MQEVLDDFTLAKTAIMDNMAIKLQCYQAPPWNFASMSHRDAEVAQAAARRIVQAFDNSPQDPALHHRKTWMHLSHGSATRTELDLFCSGVLQMRDLPHLRQVAWSARFLPVIERLQEADHSLVARGCRNAPRAGGPYVSCRLRMEEVESIFTEPGAATEYKSYLDAFIDVSKADTLAKRLGFWRHPMWVQAVLQKMSNRHKFSIAAHIMHCLDSVAQFDTMQAVSKKRKKDKETEPRGSNGGGGSFKSVRALAQMRLRKPPWQSTCRRGYSRGNCIRCRCTLHPCQVWI